MDIENKLCELQKVCNRYKETDNCADWVLYAVNRYIMTGRATRQFEKDFVSLSNDMLLDLVKYCLRHSDKSDYMIIKRCKYYVNKHKG